MWNGALSLTLKLTCLTKIYRTNLYGTIYIYIYIYIYVCMYMYIVLYLNDHVNVDSDAEMTISRFSKGLLLAIL